MRKSLILSLLAVLALGAALVGAQTPSGFVVGEKGKLDWKTSGSLPPGAGYHLVFEDPRTRAVQLLVRFKARYRMASHHHSSDETIVVIKGRLALRTASGETVLRPGSYARIPAKLPHELRSAGFSGCEFFLIMAGPYDILGDKP